MFTLIKLIMTVVTKRNNWVMAMYILFSSLFFFWLKIEAILHSEFSKLKVWGTVWIIIRARIFTKKIVTVSLIVLRFSSFTIVTSQRVYCFLHLYLKFKWQMQITGLRDLISMHWCHSANGFYSKKNGFAKLFIPFLKLIFQLWSYAHIDMHKQNQSFEDYGVWTDLKANTLETLWEWLLFILITLALKYF